MNKAPINRLISSGAKAFFGPAPRRGEQDHLVQLKERGDVVSSVSSGFNLSGVPVYTGLRTGTRVQCCARDGGSCSCPKCQAKAGADVSEGTSEAEDSGAEPAPVQNEAASATPDAVSATPEAASATPEAASASEAAPTSETAPKETTGATPSSLIVDDSTAELQEGQMKKTQFLQQLREGICNGIDPVLAGAGRSSEGCPYLNYWMGLYEGKDAAHIEQAAKKYAPDTVNAKTAEEYISIIVERAVKAAETWVATGKLSGVPEGVPTTIPGQPARENADQPAQDDTARPVQDDTRQAGVVQAKTRNGEVRKTEDPRTLQKELGEGQPLTGDVRGRMESAFGMSFSHVRTHTDATATEASHRVNARAFTVGNHIAFGNGEYQPGTMLGDALIAHELAHTIQQSGAEGSVDKMEIGGEGYDALEKDADKAAVSAVSSLWGKGKEFVSDLSKNAVTQLRSGLRLQRCDDKKKPDTSGSATPATPATPAAPAAAVNVTIPKIRAASTPAAMTVDRIPPRVDTPVAVGIAGSASPAPAVTFSIDGAGGGNGTATINGANTATLTASGTLQLRGVDQTDPGKAGNLKLVARQGTTVLASSSGFTISAVPQNWSTSLVNSITDPDAIGMIAKNCWESDSKDVNDLDKVKRKEQVEVTTKTGPWAGATQGTSSWKDATMGCIFDQHQDSPRAGFRMLGSKIANQVFVFKCERTGVTDIPATNSGLLITRQVTSGGPGVFKYDISKVGTAVTANGFSSAAASGSAIAPTQVV
ncbi:MAG: DUF4157 domain-containing protein [Chitinophagaceae bacterium]|nr:DUF4157 domain-containing protein [Chitinophagaceae bacterium]